MHHVSVTDPRAARRAQRRVAIQEQACLLVIERGYDGFTMDDLAAAVGVSRRTLFNHVPDKATAVLGPDQPADLAECGMQSFLGGEPGTDLQGDILSVIRRLLRDVEVEDPTLLRRHHLLERAVAADPKVMALAAAQQDDITRQLIGAICAREGWTESDLRAQVLAARVLGLVKVMLDEVSRRGGTVSFADVFEEVVTADAAVFGRGAFDPGLAGGGDAPEPR